MVTIAPCQCLIEQMDLVWEKLYEHVRRNCVLVFNTEFAAALKGLRVAPLGAVVTHKVKIINDCSFDVDAARGEKGGLNRDARTEDVPKCLCGNILPSLLNALTDLRLRFPHLGILLAKADVTAAFRMSIYLVYRVPVFSCQPGRIQVL